MKKTILSLLSLLTINISLVTITFPYQQNSFFLTQKINPRFYDYWTDQGILIYDAYQNQYYRTNFNGKICFNSWPNSDLKTYLLNNKIYFWYLKEDQYYYQVDKQEFIWDINDKALKTSKKPIIDLDLFYEPIKTEREWNGTLYQFDKRSAFVSNLTTSDYLICKSYSTLITKLIRSFNAKASKESFNQFDQFIDQKTFFSFKHLVNVINHHNLTSNKSNLIDVPLEKIASKVKNRKRFEDIILLLYNTLSYFFGKDQGFKILKAFTLEDNFASEGETTHGGKYRSIAIKLKTENLNPDKNKSYYNWLIGHATTYHPYATIVHEFGHLIDLYHLKSFEERINVDNCSKPDRKFSNFTNQTNVCSMNNNWFNFCGYQFNNWFNQSFFHQFSKNNYNNFVSNSNDQKKLDYCIIQTIALVQCILNNVENFNLPNNQEEQINLVFKILPYIFINSDYGRTNFFELQAEGFAYWLLAPKDERTKAWEIWNQFFLNYLPKLRAKKVKHYDWLGLDPLAIYLFYFKNNKLPFNF